MIYKSYHDDINQGSWEQRAGAEARSTIFKSFRSVFYAIFILIHFDTCIFKKNMQNVELVAENMKT
jgi:hypothetical protein